MKYTDSKLEWKFLQRHKENLAKIGSLYLFSFLIISLIYLAIVLYRDNKPYKTPPLVNTIPLVVGLMILPVINYILSRKLTFFQLQYANIEIIIFTIGLMELTIQAETFYLYGLVFREIPVLILSLVSYNQVTFTITCLTSFLYLVLRSQNFYDEGYIYTMFIIKEGLSTLICLVVSRIYLKKERDMFHNEETHKQLTTLFHKLVKIFHDGIIIINEDNILYYND
jgi:hypothetical protein